MIFIETKRLTIFAPKLEDLEEQIRLQSNPEVMMYIGNGVRNREEVKQGLQKAIHHYERFKFSLGSVYEKDTQRFVGRAGIIHLGLDENAKEIEVAYALMPEFWNQGYATELASSLAEWGFKNLDVKEIVAVTKRENYGSRKVLEKIGMKHVKDAIYHGNSIVYYSVQKTEFFERT